MPILQQNYFHSDLRKYPFVTMNFTGRLLHNRNNSDKKRRIFGNIIMTFYFIWYLHFPGGEVQEAEVHLPIISHKYTLDLSRSRSHFLPGYPLDVVVCMKLTNGYTQLCTWLWWFCMQKILFVVIIGGRASPKWFPSSWCASKDWCITINRGIFAIHHWPGGGSVSCV